MLVEIVGRSDGSGWHPCRSMGRQITLEARGHRKEELVPPL